MESVFGISRCSSALFLGLAVMGGAAIAAETPEQAAGAAAADFAVKAAGRPDFEFKLGRAGKPPPWDRAISGTDWFGILDRIRLRVHKNCLKGPRWRLSPIHREMAQIEGDLFQAAVEEGLHNLEWWSPAVVAEILALVDGRTITLECSPISVNVGGEFDRARSTITVKELDRTALWAGAAAGHFEVAPADEYQGLLRHYVGIGIPEIKATLFHEFLHFAGWNLDPSAHNQLTDSRFNERQLDRVYSCAGLAFTFGNSSGHPSSRAVAVVGGSGLPVTRLSCETCLQNRWPDVRKCWALPQGPPAGR